MTQPSDWVPFRWPAAWKPEAVTLLEKTPFNCIVISEAARGNAGALVERAAKAGIAVVMLGGQGTAEIPAIPTAPIAQLASPAASQVVALADAVWPSIPMKRSDGGDSGPTGLPWVDSNG